MATVKEYLDYAELASVSYANLKSGMHKETYKDNDGENILTNPKGQVKFSPTQATNFAKQYKVIATSQQYNIGDVSSFQAVLFGEVDSNGNVVKKILAIRGSQEPLDYVVDVAELALAGGIITQTSSMEQFYQVLVDELKISPNEKIDVTGHSLGGFLAQDFTAKHADIVNHTYTYNAPGIGGVRTEIYDKLGIIPSNVINDKITNIYAKEGLEGTAGLGVLLGDTLPVSIDDSGVLDNHRIGYLTTSLNIYNMLSSITNTQDINTLTPILEHISNEKAVNTISDIFEDKVTGSVTDKAIALTKNWSGKGECSKICVNT